MFVIADRLRMKIKVIAGGILRGLGRLRQLDGTRREGGVGGAQVHGGIGFIWEHNLQLYYKRAKASEIVFGDANYHREEIARKVVDGDED